MKTLLSYKESRIIGDTRVVIEIAVNKSNHVYLSVCGEVWNFPTRSKEPVSCGQCTKEMREFYPEFHDFLDLHLSDLDGKPMYAVDNGLYFLRHVGKDNISIDTIKRHFRIDSDEANKLISMDEFSRLGRIASYVPRWKQEMNNAIERLEQLCGQKLILD